MFTGWMLFLAPNQWHQSTEGTVSFYKCCVFFSFLCLAMLTMAGALLWTGHSRDQPLQQLSIV